MAIEHQNDLELKQILGTWLQATRYKSSATKKRGTLADHYSVSTWGWDYFPCINDICGGYRGGQVIFRGLEIICNWDETIKLNLADPKAFKKLAHHLREWHNYLGCSIRGDQAGVNFKYGK